MTVRKTLGSDDWCNVALTYMAAHGADTLTVEGLARQLGVTKGSFYWHFSDRSELIATALEYWASTATGEVITRLSAIADPRVRLRALFEVSFGDVEHGPIDTALVVRAQDPVIGDIVRRVTTARLEFLADAYRQMGLTPARARRQANIAYAAYVGHFHLVRALGPDKSQAVTGTRYLNQLVATLTPDEEL